MSVQNLLHIVISGVNCQRRGKREITALKSKHHTVPDGISRKTFFLATYTNAYLKNQYHSISNLIKIFFTALVCRQTATNMYTMRLGVVIYRGTTTEKINGKEVYMKHFSDQKRPKKQR